MMAWAIDSSPKEVIHMHLNEGKERKKKKSCRCGMSFIQKYLSTSFFFKKTYCGYSSEAPRRGASDEYPQHVFVEKPEKYSPGIHSYLELWEKGTGMWGML